MKRLVLFMMAVMLLSIIVNAQKKGGKTLVAYFSATGTTARGCQVGGRNCRWDSLRNTACEKVHGC